MDQELAELLARLSKTGSVTEGDILELREHVWESDVIPQPVLDALFTLNDRLDVQNEHWIAFFVEAVSHFMLHQQEPHGFFDSTSADWLMRRIDKFGGAISYSELVLLVTLVEDAEGTPDSIKDYALNQIEQSILGGRGPTRDGKTLRPNCVDDGEAELLRHLIFAGGGEGAVIVGQKEADLLFRIKDATLKGQNCAAWLQLFVQGVGNHLLGHSDYRPLTRDESIRLNAEMDRNAPSISGFFGRMLPDERRGVGTIIEAFKAIFPGRPDPLTGQGPQNVSSALSFEEAGWLKTQIAADGEIDIYEKALLTFVIEEVGNLPSILDSIRQRA
jgi:hypothetical protein